MNAGSCGNRLSRRKDIDHLRETLQFENDEQKSEISSLAQQVSDINDKLSTIKEDIGDMKSAMTTLKNGMSQPMLNSSEITDCGEDSSYSGVRTIKTTEGRLFSAYCEQGWTYIFKRFDGSVAFNLTWSEYKKGFGETNAEHFIGLDNLASLLKQRNYEIRIDLATWPETNENPSTRYAEYSDFKVADESDKYRLTIGGYRGTARDSMARHNDTEFTTYDRDNDKLKNASCAKKYKGAWWYTECHDSNLFGLYSPQPKCSGFGECMTWRHWPGKLLPNKDNYWYSFKKASMKIYRK
ncbi:unnamed protein product [Owenia fusiformis]|nr:unnamed protein product [Owenia fusiformis]